MLVYVLMIIGFVLLVKGAEFLVDGASAIAKKLNTSDLIIGITVVAFGTSLPELFVNIVSGIRAESAIGIGNIIGSNIANILLVLGVALLFGTITIRKVEAKFDVPISLIAVLLLAVIVNFFSHNLTLGMAGGIILLVAFVIYMYHLIFISPKHTVKKERTMKTWKASIFVLLGLTGVILGANWVVEGAATVAMLLGVSNSVIGLSVVAIGTSLPELATSIMAVRKNKSDIAFGNIIGSNLFNLLWVLGITAILTPLKFTLMNNWDMLILALVTLLLIVFVLTSTKYKLVKWHGIVFCSLYILYLGFLFLR